MKTSFLFLLTSLISLSAFANPNNLDLDSSRQLVLKACYKFSSEDKISKCVDAGHSFMEKFRPQNSTESVEVFNISLLQNICTSNDSNYQEWAKDRVECIESANFIALQSYRMDNALAFAYQLDVYEPATPENSYYIYNYENDLRIYNCNMDTSRTEGRILGDVGGYYVPLDFAAPCLVNSLDRLKVKLVEREEAKKQAADFLEAQKNKLNLH
jgi:hypothetical protein